MGIINLPFSPVRFAKLFLVLFFDFEKFLFEKNAEIFGFENSESNNSINNENFKQVEKGLVYRHEIDKRNESRLNNQVTFGQLTSKNRNLKNFIN